MKLRLRPKIKKSTLQFLAIVCLSAIAGFAVFTYTSGVESRVRSSQVTTDVFITTRQIPIGTGLGSALNQGYLESRKFPLDSVPTGAINRVDAQNSELLALQTLQPGQILLTSNFGITAANTGALVIPDGQLAITVSLSDPARVASFLQPGSEISIFVTGQSGNSKFTQVLIQRTQVLAVGTQVLPNPNGVVGSNSSALITVAVSPTQAKRLVHASQTLSLYFGLRTAGVDFGISNPVTDASILGQ